MANKKRKKRKKKKPSLSSLSASTLRQRLEKALEKGKYQDAIHAGRELLKQKDSEEARSLMRQAYIGRIHALAGKNMLKEALSLIDTMASRCGTEDTCGLRIILNIRAGAWKEAVEAWNLCSEELENRELQKIEAFLGALALSGRQEILDCISADSSLRTYFPTAENALETFCQGNTDETRKALKKIPFRSPYRDFRTLLNGCLQLTLNSLEADNFFSKIPSDSPYYNMASALRLEMAEPGRIVEILHHASPDQETMFAEVLDITYRDLKFMKSLVQASRDGFQLYRLVKTHGGCLPGENRLRLLQLLLPHCGAKVIDLLPRYKKISVDERVRIKALAAELDGMLSVAVELWQDYLGLIKPDDPCRDMKKALVLRRQAHLMTMSYMDYYQEEIMDLLLESLKFDAEDVDTWLKAVNIARGEDKQKAYRILNDAVRQLPGDARILVASMEAASERGAYKKAARLAEKVLTIDPINSRAENFLIASHLAHGRKLVHKKNYKLARAEFQAANTNARSLRYRGRNLICLGMLNILEGNREDALKLIHKGQEINGSDLPARVLTVMEAHLFKLKAGKRKEFEDDLRKAGTDRPVREEVLRLADWIVNFPNMEWKALRQCLDLLKKYMSRTAAMDWSRDEGLLLCRAFFNIHLLVALGKLTASLRKAYPDDSRIEAYELLSRTRNSCRLLNESDMDRMQDLAEEMSQAGDTELSEALYETYEELDRFDFDTFSRSDNREILDSLFDLLGMDEVNEEYDNNLLEKLESVMADMEQEEKKGRKRKGGKPEIDLPKQLDLF